MYRRRKARAMFAMILIIGDHVIQAKRLTDFAHDNKTNNENRMFFEQLTDDPAFQCRNPVRYQAECKNWRHLCPGDKTQPVEFDQFMTEWCPATCGLCKVEAEVEATPLTDIRLFAGGVAVSRTKCISTMISRRRNSGSNCQCRRRSGTRGLSVGWVCDEESNFIVYEGAQSLDQNTTCCCKQGPCSHEAVRRGDAVGQLFENSTQWCCKLKVRGMFGGCPKLSDYRREQEFSMCKRPEIKASLSKCRDRLVQWLSDEQWYKLLKGWEYVEERYAAYIPCMTEEHVHTMTIMLGVRSALAHVSTLNPMRNFIVTQPECVGLSGPELIHATTASYNELCPFGLPHASYKPDLIHDGSCSYDPLDKTIDLQEARMCVEGHRCACPVFEKANQAVESAYEGFSTYSVFATVTDSASSAADFAQTTGLPGFINIPPVSAAVAGISSIATPIAYHLNTYAWPLTVSFGAIGLVAFSGSYVWRFARHTCSRNVGCHPMDCVEEPGRGCRIRAPEDLSDERNPFWFLPPPTYKCAYKRRRCQLSQCSKRNLWRQTVGLVSTKSFGKTRNTQVFNCQPMLVEDMSAGQRQRLEVITAGLKTEYETARRINKRMRYALEKACPWSRPTKDNVLRCHAKMSCTATLKNQSCCENYGGIKQCPENFPLMCRDGYCGNDEDLCQKRGGVRPCPSARECPWMVPSPVSGHAECLDGSYSKANWFHKSTCKQDGREGIKRCPWEIPVMCHNRACNGDYCCASTAKNCERYGGPRECETIEVDEDGEIHSEVAEEDNEISSFQKYNKRLMKSIEGLREKREKKNRQIIQKEEDKAMAQKEIIIWTKKLQEANESLAQTIQMRNEYEKMLQETEAAYETIVKSSRVILDLTKRDNDKLTETDKDPMRGDNGSLTKTAQDILKHKTVNLPKTAQDVKHAPPTGARRLLEFSVTQ